MGGQYAFDAAGHRVVADTPTGVIVPAQALFLQIAGLGRQAQIGRAAVAVGLLRTVWPPAVSAAVSSSFIAKRSKVTHTSRAVPERSGLSVHAIRVQIDETHHHGRERILQITLTRVTAVGVVAGCQSFLFGAPADILLGMPEVFPAEA